MRTSTLQSFLGRLRRLTDPTRSQELSDADLLERFRLHREEAAFTLLMQRHGPMIFAVCRRIVGNAYDAEDAFQATFLVLVRKAGSIHKQHSLAAWLHRVACRLALKARAQSARRQLRESAVAAAELSEDCPDTLAVRELRAALDEEIERLPDKYRMPLVLCYFADKTHEQAAVELGWPKSSVTARLARARELLQQRLLGRGFSVPAGLLAALLTEQAANAAVPSLLTLSTVRLAGQALAGETAAATSAAALAGSFVKSTMALKLTATLVLLATLGFAAVGYRIAATGSSSPSEQPATKAATLSEPLTAKPEPRTPRVDLFGDPLPDEAVARIGSGRLRHSATGHRSLLFSPDGKQLVSCAYEGLRIWDTATGKPLRRFDFARGNNQTSCRYVGDSIISVNVGAAWMVTVQVLDAATGEVRRRVRIKELATVFNPTLSPNGKLLAVPHKNDIGLYETATGEIVQRIPVKGIAAWSIAFDPDSKSIAFNDLSDTIYLHDAATGKLIRELKRPGDAKLHLVFSPDGRFLASMPQNLPIQQKGEISIWSLREGKEVQRWTYPAPMAASAEFSPDGKCVAVGGARWGLILWDVETGKEIRRLSPQGGALHIAYSPDGKTLAAASPGGAIRLWNAATGKLLPASADPQLQSVDGLHFSNDGKCLFGVSGVCLIWDPTTGRELRRLADCRPWDFKHATDQHYLALSPDESLLAAAHPEEGVILVDAATGKQRRVLKGGDRWVHRLTFTPDGRRLVTSGDEKKLRVWDVVSGRKLRAWGESGGYTACLAISADCRWLASAPVLYRVSKYDVTLWDLATGAEKRRFFMTRNFPSALAFSPDARFLAAAGGGGESNQGEVRVWDVQDGQEHCRLEGRFDRMNSVAFSPDGRTLATGGVDGLLLLWELASGRRRHRFIGHEAGVLSLAFSPHGHLLAASSADAPVYVWEVTGSLQAKPHRLSNDQLQHCWSALAGEDASAAFQAIRRLASVPEQTLLFLLEHLKPVPAPDQKRIRRLVDMLDSEDFQQRQDAAKELEKQGDAAAAILQQILANDKPSLEVRRRLQQVIESIGNQPQALRAVRAVEVLEWIATPEAGRMLDELAKSTADARLTREAAAAKRRLQR